MTRSSIPVSPRCLYDDFRLETGIPVPRHADLHRPASVSTVFAVAVAGIAAITARGIVIAVTGIIQLALQSALGHQLGQPAQQPAFAGQP
jgi:hypothetical protein